MKGQTSTEYLIILAVVIIIAVLVIGVLGGIPGVGSGTGERSSDLELATLEVGISDVVLNSIGATFNVINNKGKEMTISHASFSGKNCSFSEQMVLKAGQSKRVTCFGPRFSETSQYAVDFEIGYTDGQTNAVYTNIVPSDVQVEEEGLGGAVLHTGQSTCIGMENYGYGTLSMVACDATHLGQDGNIDGTIKSFSQVGDASDNILLDDHTGLMWTTNETGDVTRTVANSTCNNLDQGGYTDWRLPNAIEFTTVMNSGATNPSPNGEWTNDYYWSSTYQSNPYYWRFVIASGSFLVTRGTDASATSTRSVCVRGLTTGISFSDGAKNFVDVGDGTVVDTDTGIVWAKAAYYSGTNYWNNSIEYCDNLGTGGYSDWRVPTASEGATLIDYSEADYKNDVFDWNGNDYWTGTTQVSPTFNAYFIDMFRGYVDGDDKNDDISVRCVRDQSVI